MPSAALAFDPRIRTLRGTRVILDADLARIYGVPTKRRNEAVKRNCSRFPRDFAFRLTARESVDLRSQVATSSAASHVGEGAVPAGHGGRRHRPWAFTEHGALMAANVLRSRKAATMSVYVVRAFVRQREHLLTTADVLRRLAEIDSNLMTHDSALRTTWEQLEPLLTPPPEEPSRRIGFHSEA